MSESVTTGGHCPDDYFQPATNETSAKVEDDSFQLDSLAGAKQRRKRTSPHDHAVLESAYQKNSKPDKEERLLLVELVHLGEKEVQIWFQNRRQNDRRKSKPLQPHELIPHFRNGIPVEARTQLPSPEQSQEAPESHENKSGHDTIEHDHQPPSSQPQDRRAIGNNSDRANDSSPTAVAQQRHVPDCVLSTPPSSREEIAQSQDNVVSSTDPSPSQPLAAGQITKKRSHEEMAENSQLARVQDDSMRQSKTLRRTSSFVRLAVSADGSVKVRVNDETTPSPPKERPQPPTAALGRRSSGITRAQSDVSNTFEFKDTVGAIKGALGRSRDARTWEFYCDRNARSSLAACAEEAATGSAVGAIGLMRSASYKRSQPLSPNPAKHNNPRRKQSGPKTKPTLSRAQSSMARLQGSEAIKDSAFQKQQKGNRQPRSPGSDSDKENWQPGTRASVHELRRTEPTTQRGTILQPPSQSESAHSHPTISLPSEHDQENRPLTATRKDKGDDLDCVQGLLSLSQGAWR